MSVGRVIPLTRSGSAPSDAALVVAARAGETSAREALFRRHAPRLFGLAFRIIGYDDDIEDLVHDAFVDAFEGLGKLDEPSSFSSWVGTILVRRTYQRIRRARLLARLGFSRGSRIDLEEVVSHEASPEMALEIRTLYGVLEEMSASVRVCLVLHRVEGLSLADTSAAVGLSLATVKRRIGDGEAILRSRGIGPGGSDE